MQYNTDDNTLTKEKRRIQNELIDRVIKEEVTPEIIESSKKPILKFWT
jgi:hypothetical protein